MEVSSDTFNFPRDPNLRLGFASGAGMYVRNLEPGACSWVVTRAPEAV